MPKRGLLKLWNAMQKIVCGSYKEVGEEDLHPKGSKSSPTDSSANELNLGKQILKFMTLQSGTFSLIF